jgi:pimeloyl-ACP methyl ester carboxylesterase
MASVRINGVQIHHDVTGHGEPIVLITGLGGDVSFWKRHLPPLSARHKVITVDNRGSGRSDVDGEFTMEDLGDDVAGLLTSMGIFKAHVVGWSMGGNIAQEVALRHPDMVGSLILMSSYTRRPERSSYAIDAMVKAGLEGASYDTVMAQMMAWCMTEAAFVGRRSKGASGRLSSGSLLGFQRQKQALDGFDSRGRLHEIKIPTLILHGTMDIMVPPHFAEELHRGIAGSELDWIEGAGHIMPAEPCCTRILEFLEKHTFD